MNRAKKTFVRVLMTVFLVFLFQGITLSPRVLAKTPGGGILFPIVKKVTYSGNGHEYAVMSVSLGWKDAQKYCETMGGHLATVTSQGEMDFIISLVSNGAKTSYWLGGTDEAAEGVWKWVTDEPFNYKNWNNGEPNGAFGYHVENYIEMYSNGKWNDAESKASSSPNPPLTFGFICEWEKPSKIQKVKYPGNGNEYAVISESLSWKDAQKFCETLGGHLATVTSQGEMDFITNLKVTGTKTSYWLGGTDEAAEGTWKWITGEPFKYKNWNNGEPNGYSGYHVENYIEMYSNGKWNDMENQASTSPNPLSTFGFICEWDNPVNIQRITNSANGHDYAVISMSLSWKEAKEYCENLGGYLATVTSQNEMDFINSLRARGTKKSYWLGGTDEAAEGLWKWVTGEQFYYNSWDIGEPNGGSGYHVENYIALNSSGRWNDMENKASTSPNPLSTFGFICEWGKPDVIQKATFPGNNHDYAVISESLSWKDAQKYCETLGGHLATVTLPDEMDFIKNLIADGTKKSYWLGGTDEKIEGVWKWVTDEPFKYKNWAIGLPDGNFGYHIENYIEMYGNGMWNDMENQASTSERPLSTFGFICEWEKPSTIQKVTYSENGHNYAVISLALSWKDAKEYCENLGGHLATVTSQGEMDFIKDLMASGTKTNYWLGGTDEASEGLWRWVTGEPFKFKNWDSGQPDGYYQYHLENYIEMYSNGKWNDMENQASTSTSPLSTFGFICEWE